MDLNGAAPSIQISALKGLSLLVRTGAPPDPMEAQEALERGFGLLMSLEARLQRTRLAATASDPAVAREVAELLASITDLRDALTGLQELTRHSPEPRAGYGFVLPRGAAAADPGASDLPGAS